MVQHGHTGMCVWKGVCVRVCVCVCMWKGVSCMCAYEGMCRDG